MGDELRPLDYDAEMRQGLRAVEMAYLERGRAMESELNSMRARLRELQAEARDAEASAQDSHNDKLALELRLRALEQQNRELRRENTAISSEKEQLELTFRSLRKDLALVGSFKQPAFASSRVDETFSSGCGPAYARSPGSHRVLAEDTSGSRLGGATGYGLGSPQPPPARDSLRRTSPASGPRGGHGCSPSPRSAPGTAGPSPPYDGARVDGQDFFRTARARLSREQFGRFLESIRQLNDYAQSREATLEQVRQAFGEGNEDLLATFRALLAHHGLI